MTAAKTNRKYLMVAAAILLLAYCGCGQTTPPTAPAAAMPFVFGMVLVGPYNDHGWSTAHYEAGKYLESQIPGSRMIYIDNLNPAAKPGVTVPQVVDDLVAKGARLIFTTSDDFKDGTLEAALRHPEVPIVNVSGDHAWKEGRAFKAPANLSNFMGRMEYGEIIAGYAAGLTTQTGKIGYLGPLINDETRRLAACTYLGARQAWVNERRQDPAKFKFKVTWIGFWFNLPGVTLDPSKVAADFFSSGYDVVLSGIDTTEVLTEALKFSRQKTQVWASPYNYRDACAEAPAVAIGVPFFNWNPAYLKVARMVLENRWTQFFEWTGPDWADINSRETSAIGFTRGAALSAENGVKLDQFIKGLADGSIQPLRGPLNFQDGSVFLKDGETATDAQIWYLPQLFAGMTGPSK